MNNEGRRQRRPPFEELKEDMTEPPITSTTLGDLRGSVEDDLCVFRGVP